MKNPAFSVAVYCGSRLGATPTFERAAREVGRWIGAHQGQLVYGGGRNGLMGVVADACLAADGQVIGVIPKSMVEREWAHDGCHELIVIDTMHERKRIMAERADAFLALPGGIGTFEEFFEAWTWRQLGFHDKPVGLLNVDAYYDALLQFLQHSVTSQFMGGAQMALIRTGTDPVVLLKELVEAAGFSPQARLDGV